MLNVLIQSIESDVKSESISQSILNLEDLQLKFIQNILQATITG